MICPLCSYAITPDEALRACQQCPLAQGGCQLVRCPRCGYEWAEESRLLKGLNRIWQWCRGRG